MTEEEYNELEPYYSDAQKLIPTWDRISVIRVQRHFKFGYNRAARMLEMLAENGYLHWDRITGEYSRPS